VITYLPDEIRNTVEEWKLFVNGGEYLDPGVPHVTIYGPVLSDAKQAAQQIQTVMSRQDLPAEVVIGNLKVFRNPEQHVLVLSCQSHGLAALYRDLKATVPSPLAAHDLNLHITMAYGEPGAFDRYDGASLAGLAGHRYLVTEAVFGTREVEYSRFRIGKPEVLGPGPNGITFTVKSAESEDAPYGYCPVCGGKGVSRDRAYRDGNTRCVNGHEYASEKSLKTAEEFKDSGLSTTSGEQGGFVTEPAKVIAEPIQKAAENPARPVVSVKSVEIIEPEDDDDDDPWLEKTNSLIDSLEE